LGNGVAVSAEDAPGVLLLVAGTGLGFKVEIVARVGTSVALLEVWVEIGVVGKIPTDENVAGNRSPRRPILLIKTAPTTITNAIKARMIFSDRLKVFSALISRGMGVFPTP
jgi:hypothetical protein